MKVAVTNACLFPSDKRVVILIDHGKVSAVGDDVSLPQDTSVIDAAGRPVTPGLVEAHAHVGVLNAGIGWEGRDHNETTDPITPQVDAHDAINPEDRGFMDLLRGGITTVQVIPGSANIIGGTGLAIKTKPTALIDDVVVKLKTGMKAALGENPKRAYGVDKKRNPSTRMGSAALLREWLFKTIDYQNKKETSPDQAEYDARLEALLPVIRREMPLRIHAHRADDIVTAIRIAEEFSLCYSIEHATQGDKIADYLAERQVLCAVGPSFGYEAKVELEDVGFSTSVRLHRAGVPFCLTTDHPVVRGEYLHMLAGMASAYGLGDEAALMAVTQNPARHLGLSDRVGTLEPGKDADLVIWSGDPLDGRSLADVVIIDGEAVYRSDESSSKRQG